MAKRHKKIHHEEHVDESWLIPYADLLTLLLALFIVLFASSQIDQEKATNMAQSMQSELGLTMGGGSGIMEGQGSELIVIDETIQPPEEAQTLVDKKYKSIEDIEKNFNNYVLENNLSSQISLNRLEDSLYITLTSDVWFNSGSADISPTHKKLGEELMKMIDQQKQSGLEYKIVVTGHTDNVPIVGSRDFNSNWQLSVTRAVNFMEVLMQSSTTDPANFSARGLGEYKPIYDNNNVEGRQKNRRVEVFLTFVE